MSQKDEAVGRVIRLLEQCQATTVVRFADELEESLEVGPYGVVCSRQVEGFDLEGSPGAQKAYETLGSGV